MVSTNIRVVARFRPINAREIAESVGMKVDIKYYEGTRVEIETNSMSILGDNKYTFDHVFGPETTQVDFYEKSCRPVVDDVLKGYNGTIFAYGQTGAGKSWSMMGALNSEENKGLMPRAANAIFQLIQESEEGSEFKVSCSYLEIYNESIQDLFNTENKNLGIRESPDKGIHVAELTEQYVGSEEEIYQLMEMGSNNRVVSFTHMNATSSRSHSVFIIRVEQKTPMGISKHGKLNLVDLAGSEKIGKTGATGQTLEEAKKINQSLSTLGQCINALVEKKGHVPYRDSKLTRVLQESLGGNSKTTMICACSPHPFNLEETISTLKFGQRAKSIKLSVRVNAVKSSKELQAIVEKLTIQVKQLKKSNANLLKGIELLKSGKELPSEMQNEILSAATEAANNASQGSIKKKEGDENEDEEEEEEDGTGPSSEPLRLAQLQVQLDNVEAKYKNDIEILEEEIEEMLTSNNIMKEKYDKEVEDRESLEEELESILDENDKLVKKLEDAEKEIQYGRKEIESELDEALKTIEELEDNVVDLEKQIRAARENANLKPSTGTVNDFVKNISDAEARGKVMAELNALRENDKLQKELIEKLTNELNRAQDGYKEEKISNVEQDSAISQHEEAQKRAMDKLNKQVELLTQKIQESERDAKENEDAMMEYETDINRSEAH
ncbi:kinesin heavy chain [Acrasis kona]|uniref:Kinesin-like protein n=1 Tax=Acrasis kona TaxID=1008807 RepID=A0AAW2Z185_9EUKA